MNCFKCLSLLHADINECNVNNGGCRADKHAYCSNYPGGYYCACSPGYILKDNSLTECVGMLLVVLMNNVMTCVLSLQTMKYTLSDRLHDMF